MTLPGYNLRVYLIQKFAVAPTQINICSSYISHSGCFGLEEAEQSQIGVRSGGNNTGVALAAHSAVPSQFWP